MKALWAMIQREPARFAGVITAASSLIAALAPSLSTEARVALVGVGVALAEWVRYSVVPVVKLEPPRDEP